MKLLVSGASGLLGTDIVFEAESAGVECVKLCRSRREGFAQADLTTEAGLKEVESLEWDALVHTAAWRSPEECDKDKDGAMAINVKATESLAKIAARRKAWMLYISTDYVFPGTNPPYAEDSPTEPLNTYGMTKLLGERAALENCSGSCSLRIPFLYGWRAGLGRAAMISSTLKALKSETPIQIDNSIVRYPTCTCDVAKAVMFLAGKKAHGIHHFSASDKSTRYTIALLAAEIIGCPCDKLVPTEAAPQADTKRPKDAHLSMEKLLSMGFKEPPPFRERFELCLGRLGLARTGKA